MCEINDISVYFCNELFVFALTCKQYCSLRSVKVGSLESRVLNVIAA